MRPALWIFVCLLWFVGTVAAEDESASPVQVADEVLQAFEAQDQDALMAVARRFAADPWLVADVLCSRGEHAAAEAFAKAAPGKSTAKLPAFVASRKAKGGEAAGRKVLEQMLAAGSAKEALAIADGAKGPADSVIQVRVDFVRGMALLGIGENEKAYDALLAAAEAARDLGWITMIIQASNAWGSAAWDAGDHSSVVAAMTLRLEAFRELGDEGMTAMTLAVVGEAHFHARRYEEAAGPLAEAAKSFRELGGGPLGRMLSMLGSVQLAIEQPEEAAPNLDEALRLAREEGDKDLEASTLVSIGVLRLHSEMREEAIESFEESLPIFRELESEAGVATALNNIGRAFLQRGDYRSAISYLERGLRFAEEADDERWIAAALVDLGDTYEGLSDYMKANAYYERALTKMQAMGDKAGAAEALLAISGVYSSLGDLANELSINEQALELAREMSDKDMIALLLLNRGAIYGKIGEEGQALSYTERAVELLEELGDNKTIAGALINLGLFHEGDDDAALSYFERGLAIAEKSHPEWAANGLVNIAAVHGRRNEYAKKLSVLERAFAMYEELGDKKAMEYARVLVGATHAALGRPEEGIKLIKQAVRATRRLRTTDALVSALATLGEVYLDAGKHELALSAAQSGLRELEELLGGLGEEEGASARAQYSWLFDVGILAAARVEEPAEALAFLESGRAGALLESLGGRQALRWTDLPETLRAAETKAKAAEARALRSYERALKAGKRKETRAAADVLDEARDQLRAVAARIQRDAKKQAGLYYPRAATLEEIQETLEEDEALVLYALCDEEALAMVLRPDGERIVSLGASDDVESACAALDASDPDQDPTAALDALRKLLVQPLKLEAGVTLVIVSPDGPLGYVPFGALFEQAVAFTPSGTTHGLLKQETHAGGEGVLALGDPDYAGISEGATRIYVRGKSLARLPATRAEVEAIGDEILLGAKANENELRAALAKRARWRVVHLACHGLVDPERPTLSSLALTGTEEGDGFLTAMEVLRMEIPADLAVLSACETGKGKIVSGEGIVGLTRAFMYAGAPRVICSLWKVDDEATQALMIKFYELWNPKNGTGLGAADALDQAQAFIRSQEKWKHPYYWAAWVLWGLSD